MESGPAGTDRPRDGEEDDAGTDAPGTQAPESRRPEKPLSPYAPLHEPDREPPKPSFGPQAPASWDDPAIAPPGGPQAPASGPQAPPPSGYGPQAPPPGGPQAPASGPQAPPSSGYGPQAPSGYAGAPPQAPPPPAYGGPVPPGGWQAPLGQAPGWGGAPLASWGSRVVAQLLDWLILLVPVAILGGIVAGIFIAGSDVGGVIVAIVFFGIYTLLTIFYAPLLMSREGRHNGQTWGKQVVGIAVVRDTGEPVGLGYALLRQFVVITLLFGWVGSFFFSIPTIVNYLWPLWDGQNRALHDMIVSSHVVRR